MKDITINLINKTIHSLNDLLNSLPSNVISFFNPADEEQRIKEANEKINKAISNYQNYIKLSTELSTESFQKIYDPSKLSDFERKFIKNYNVEVDKSCNNFFKTYVKIPSNSSSSNLLKLAFDKINIPETIGNLDNLIKIPNKNSEWIHNFIAQLTNLAIKLTALNFFKSIKDNENLNTIASLPHQKLFSFFKAKYIDSNATLPLDENLFIAGSMKVLESVYRAEELSLEDKYPELMKKLEIRNRGSE